MKRKSQATDSNRPTKKVKFADDELGGFLGSDDDDDKEQSAESATTADQAEDDPFFGVGGDDDDFLEKDEFDLNDFDDESDSKKQDQSPTKDDDDDDFLGLGSDDDDSEEYDKLEAMASLQEERQKRLKEEEEAEMREQRYETEQERAKEHKFEFPSMKTLLAERESPPQLEVLKNRIESVLEILASFKALSDGKHMRKQYVDVLAHSMARYYGYNTELIGMFLTMFNPNECLAFLEANEQSRPLTIRCNSMKSRRRDLAKMLIDRGVNLDPLADWTKEGLKIAKSGNNVPIGATPEYLAGYYMIQSAASLLPVMALGVNRQMRVLDMCAAPGGKTTHMAQLLRGAGVVVANDSNPERLKAVYGNVHRMGFKNVVIIKEDGRKLNHRFNPIFDRVLLDAPCSCLGVISRDPSIKYNKKFNDVIKMASIQKELILTAIDCCKVGGFVVYSTCSVSYYENEAVVDHAINRRFIKVIPTGLPFGEEGFTKLQDKRFHHSIKNTMRYYPHVHNLDGFYVAKLQKTGNGKRGDTKYLEEADGQASKNRKRDDVDTRR